MSEPRKKPAVAFWATAAAIVLVLYVTSFGPACWIAIRADWNIWSFIRLTYRPILWLGVRDEMVASAIRWYMEAGAPDGWTAIFGEGALGYGR